MGEMMPEDAKSGIKQMICGRQSKRWNKTSLEAATAGTDDEDIGIYCILLSLFV